MATQAQLDEANQNIANVNVAVSQFCSNQSFCGSAFYQPDCYTETKDPNDAVNPDICKVQLALQQTYNQWRNEGLTGVPPKAPSSGPATDSSKISGTTKGLLWAFGILIVAAIVYGIGRSKGWWGKRG